jgi:hypothetical protein
MRKCIKYGENDDTIICQAKHIIAQSHILCLEKGNTLDGSIYPTDRYLGVLALVDSRELSRSGVWVAKYMKRPLEP